MRQSPFRPIVVAALSFAASMSPPLDHAASLQNVATAKPLSFHNRLLLNRLAISGVATSDVMLAVVPGKFEEARERVARSGGRVRRAEPDINYLRASIPIERLVEFVTSDAVEAYQVSSLSTANWYSDGFPQSSAELQRTGEERLLIGPVSPPPTLPQLSPELSRTAGFTADDDVGIGRWRAQHPTFDGRGVTIAFMETALVQFDHPALQSATAIDGSAIPKVVGILNALGEDDADETRVDLTVHISTRRIWHRVGHRTYIMPRPGEYRLGIFSLPVATGVAQRYAVIRDELSRQLWVDTNGDADFRDESPMEDVNTRIDVRQLRILYPREAQVSFVVGAGRQPHHVHVYTATSGHATMAISVAAGNASVGGLASGVAPGAQALVVRYLTRSGQFHTILEGYLDTIRRPDVDILCDSTGIQTVPDTGAAFATIFFRRLVDRYRKPIFHSAGNAPRFLNNVSALGGIFSVGGSIGPATFASLYGGAAIHDTVVHPMSAAGPSPDGALKPDFLVPENRVSAGVWIDQTHTLVPKNTPSTYLPPGYEISCCTSAASPYAAGVAALLLSAAKQEGLSYTLSSFGHALRVSARFLSSWPAHQQGNGVLDIDAAWQELKRSTEVPRIRVTASNAQPLTPYAASDEGSGLFEKDRWSVGMRGNRVIRLTRESGPVEPINYRVSLTGNNGTFAAPAVIALARGETTELRVSIAAQSAGAHSAILNLHEPRTGSVASRTALAIVVAPPAVTAGQVTRLSGSIPLLRADEHFIDVPEGVSALSVELEVLAGSLTATLLPPDGLYRDYYAHAQPLLSPTFAAGGYRFLWPHPPPGRWTIHLSNMSAFREGDEALVSTADASYIVTVQALAASLDLRKTADNELRATIRNRGGTIAEPVVAVSRGSVRSHNAKSLSSGLPYLIDIEVPDAASSLQLRLSSMAPSRMLCELDLYDCSSGECFLWDFTLPAKREHSMVVRTPTPGRWVAAITAAPLLDQSGPLTLEEVITMDTILREPLERLLPSTERSWTARLAPSSMPLHETTSNRVLVWELFDAAAERDAAARAWENRRGVPNLGVRPIALGRGLWPLE